MPPNPIPTASCLSPPLQGSWVVQAKSRLYFAGQSGKAWRVQSGAVRLDAEDHGEPDTFAGLAIKGDVIGAEVLLLGRYTFSATALSPCSLIAWPSTDTAPTREFLLGALTDSTRRAATLLSIRSGQAIGRVRRLMDLLAVDASPARPSWFFVPSLSDMADITGLAAETVSRAISQLRREGFVSADQERRGNAAMKALRFPANDRGLPDDHISTEYASI